VKIILLSQVSDPTDYYETLSTIYYSCFLEFIKRDPFYKHGDPLSSPYFIEKITEILGPYVK
jgi:hypothetical protein